MDINKFAQMLNGRECGNEISRGEAKQAKELGFVVVYGASDDLMEFEGAIEDELGCWDGGIAYLSINGLLEYPSNCEDCKFIKSEKERAKKVEAVWCGGDDWAWQYKTNIPHTIFEIFEDSEKYCKGIVFDINNLGE